MRGQAPSCASCAFLCLDPQLIWCGKLFLQTEFSGRSGDHPASIAGRARRKRRASKRWLQASEFGSLASLWPASRFASWAHVRTRTAIVGQILTRSLLKLDVTILAALQRLFQIASGNKWKRFFSAKSWTGAVLSRIVVICSSNALRRPVCDAPKFRRAAGAVRCAAFSRSDAPSREPFEDI